MKDKILFSIPFIIYLLFGFIIVIQGLSIKLFTFIISAILLFITGIGLESNKKDLKTIGFCTLAIFTILYLIMGYYDYLKWTSSIVGIINLIYFILIYLLKKH